MNIFLYFFAIVGLGCVFDLTSKPYGYFFLVRVFDIKSGWVLENLNRPDRQNMWSYILDRNRPTRDILRSPVASRLQALFISGAPGSLVGLCYYHMKIVTVATDNVSSYECKFRSLLRSVIGLMRWFNRFDWLCISFLSLFPDVPNNHLRKLIIEIHTFVCFKHEPLKS